MFKNLEKTHGAQSQIHKFIISETELNDHNRIQKDIKNF